MSKNTAGCLANRTNAKQRFRPNPSFHHSVPAMGHLPSRCDSRTTRCRGSHGLASVASACRRFATWMPIAGKDACPFFFRLPSRRDRGRNTRLADRLLDLMHGESIEPCSIPLLLVCGFSSLHYSTHAAQQTASQETSALKKPARYEASKRSNIKLQLETCPISGRSRCHPHRKF